MGFIHIFKTIKQNKTTKNMRASKQDQNYAWNRRAKPTSQKLAKEQQSNLGGVDLLGESQIITATTMEKKTSHLR